MKKIEDFVPEEVIEKMIAALQDNYERLPVGKPRTAAMQLLVPLIMKNKERGESVRNILSIINNIWCIAKKEDIEAIIAANTKDIKQDSAKRKRRTKTSEQNDTENDNSVQNTSSGPKKDTSGTEMERSEEGTGPKKEAFGTEMDLSGEEKVSNEVGNENVNGNARDDTEHLEDLKDHNKDDSGGNDRNEKDIGAHDPEPQKDTAGGIQVRNGSEQVPKNDGTFIVEDDIEDL